MGSSGTSTQPSGITADLNGFLSFTQVTSA
ncbi:hypothetical protein [Enterobacter hormaechei]